MDQLAGWAETYGMTTVPVLGFTEADISSLDGLAYQIEGDLYIPTMYTIGRDMTVLAADDMNTDPSSYLGN